MDKAQFATYLQQATQALLPFMRSLVRNPLPDTPRYVIALSEGYYTALAQDASSALGAAFSQPVAGFPALATQHGWVRAVPADAVVALLWQAGSVPVWINVEVHSADSTYTYITLACSDRLTADATQMYHADEGYPPFHVVSGFLPSGWQSVEQHGKFDLGQTRR